MDAGDAFVSLRSNSPIKLGCGWQICHLCDASRGGEEIPSHSVATARSAFGEWSLRILQSNFVATGRSATCGRRQWMQDAFLTLRILQSNSVGAGRSATCAFISLRILQSNSVAAGRSATCGRRQWLFEIPATKLSRCRLRRSLSGFVRNHHTRQIRSRLGDLPLVRLSVYGSSNQTRLRLADLPLVGGVSGSLRYQPQNSVAAG